MGEGEPADLRVELSGIELKNPVLVCSGTFGDGGRVPGSARWRKREGRSWIGRG